MYEEQFLISKGCPLEDAVTLCHSLRREGKLEDFMRETESVCNCGNRHFGGCSHVYGGCPCRDK